MKIETHKQYQAVKDLGYLLQQLGHDGDFVNGFVNEYGGDFEECYEGCGYVINECQCKNYERPSPYDDDSSFE